MKHDVLDRWTAESARELYGIDQWGAGLFQISTDGDLLVSPDPGRANDTINLKRLVDEVSADGTSTPILFRFSDVIRSRIEQLNQDFDRAIREAGYKGIYRGVYPIKVNQHSQVVQDVIDYGGPFHFGLEAGTKAELILAVALTRDPDALLICNGYKDAKYVDLALYAQKMGQNVHFVVEMPSEMRLILARAARMNIEPRLGFRAKLSSRGAGRWDSSTGDRSKFGLGTSELIAMFDQLKAEGKHGCLRMLHYHLGSQISDIRRIRVAVVEAACIYSGLVREGAPMGILNVGGGFAVDYDGSQSNSEGSCNYGGSEYAADIVEGIITVLDSEEIPHPTIVSESGRAITAHHAALVINVLDTKRLESRDLPADLPDDAPETLHSMTDVYRTVNSRNVQESFHDAVYYRDDIRNQFVHGDLTLRQRAAGENLFWHTIRKIRSALTQCDHVPDELQKLDATLSDHYFCNFSTFQSLPDTWALGQVFPVVPIHRLNSEPTRPGVLADITCDSDGKLDKFPSLHDVKRYLMLHELDEEDYYLAVLLVGAYQETLGDMHNLLGDVNIVQVRIDESGAPAIIRRVEGDTVSELLGYNEYNTSEMVARIEDAATRACSSGKLDVDESQDCINAFRAGLNGYTYFEK